MFKYHHPSSLLWHFLELPLLAKVGIFTLISLLIIGYPSIRFFQLNQQHQQLQKEKIQLQQQVKIKAKTKLVFQQKITQQNQNQSSEHIRQLENQLRQLLSLYPALNITQQWQFNNLTQAEIHLIANYTEQYYALSYFFSNLPTGWKIERIKLEKNQENQMITSTLALFHY